MSCPCFICLAMYNLYFWCIAIIIRQTTRTTQTTRYLQIFILFLQGGFLLVIHGVINPYKWPTNEWVTGVMTSINGAICCPWPCITCLPGGGLRGHRIGCLRRWRPIPPMKRETRDPFLEELLKSMRNWTMLGYVMMFFLGRVWLFVTYLFFRKKHQHFQFFIFCTPNWTLEKKT